MKENLFLVPVVYPEFERTVEDPIDLTGFSISSNNLSDLTDPKETRIWGVRDSSLNRRFYQKMMPRDILLFYNSGDYIYKGRVGAKFQSQEISRQYWDDIPANLLYSVKDLEKLSLPKEYLNEACEYKINYQPQSLRIVDTQPLWKLERKHGTVQDFLAEYR